jgi:hypothetical protein
VTSWPLTWKSGNPQNTVLLPWCDAVSCEALQESKISFSCVRTAIFGSPVVPPVQK